jgi:predicted membrane protein
MLVGAWFGRARWLIPIGVVLAVALGIGSLAENVDGGPDSGRRDVRYQPTTVAQVQPSYQMGAGDFSLDMSAVDFTGVTRIVEVNTGLGDVDIQLPEDVDVTVKYDVGAGDAQVLEQREEGVGIQNTYSDDGENGPDSSDLTLVIHHGAGDLEVSR